jgi:cob(I)alamin adenosyltransferase
MKVYTRAGDDGDTGMGTGDRIRKSNLRIEAYGTIDELNSWVGLALVDLPDAESKKELLRVQNSLHKIMAELSKPLKEFEGISDDDIGDLELSIDFMESKLTPLTRFILPGGSRPSAVLHVCRTVCRRGERRVVELAEKEIIDKRLVKYLNRLSDYLFVLARKINHDLGTTEAHPDY